MKIAEKIKLQFKFLKLGLNLVYLKPWFKLEMKIWALKLFLTQTKTQVSHPGQPFQDIFGTHLDKGSRSKTI